MSKETYQLTMEVHVSLRGPSTDTQIIQHVKGDPIPDLEKIRDAIQWQIDEYHRCPVHRKERYGR